MSRNSKQKQEILKVLNGTMCHPDADWIYKQVKINIPRISLGTVYRNLKLLKQAGVIRELSVAGNLSHFDCNTQPHYHFRCHHCGTIFDLDEKMDSGLEERVARKTGFRITDHNLEFVGLCTGCQESPQQSSGERDQHR